MLADVTLQPWHVPAGPTARPPEEEEAEEEARAELLPVGSPNCQPCTILSDC